MDEELRPREEAVAEEKKERKEKEKLDWRKEFYSELRMLAVVLTVTILIFHFLTQLVVVVGSSMYPTLHEDDLLIAWRAGYEPRQGDIVVLHKETEYIKETVVKRIIATGGQTVEIDYDENAVYVDGVRLDEPYLNREDEDVMIPKGDVKSIDIPEGSVFVMGDNRNRSTDSRSTPALGVVDEDYIIGKAVFIFYPFDHMGLLEN
ncbi:MAG: signal peptidase I [Oscillospiraceae bacterium]|nr:signal peptidase I [Oscillospiraceae bacterium]